MHASGFEENTSSSSPKSVQQQMGNSMESSRPIMAPSVASKRTSKRFSTFSGVPSIAASDNTTQTTTSQVTGDPRIQEIKEWTQGFDRLEQKQLQQQRYAPTAEKTASLSKLALGAKVERALGRRMTDQDATFRPKLLGEKQAMGRSLTTAS